MATATPRGALSQPLTVGDVVGLDRDCEIGTQGERAVVLAVIGGYVSLVFPNRAAHRLVLTGADYRYLKPAVGAL